MKRALYNEIEPFAVQWMRNLESRGHIAPGVVDDRSISDLRADELAPYTQAHFFAGIGVWSYALRAAGWPDDAPVWTGSCPCQPFSVAGKGDGFDDARHLWPVWFNLIRQCRPPVVFGEQVEGADGRAWLDLVSADLEGIGYAFAAAILPAAGIGAPHIRHRSFFVAYAAESGRIARRGAGVTSDGRDAARLESGRLRDAGGLGDTNGERAGRNSRAGAGTEAARERAGFVDGDIAHDLDSSGAACFLGHAGHAGHAGPQGHSGHGSSGAGREEPNGSTPTSGFWGDAEWIHCRDGKWRPVEPGAFPLAYGAPGRVGRLRAYGNAINAEVAVTFIRAAMPMVFGGAA